MNFPVAIRTEQNAFIEFNFGTCPTPRVPAGGDPKILGIGRNMVKFQRFKAPVISATRAFPAFILD
jgi:hypothetical protein